MRTLGILILIVVSGVLVVLALPQFDPDTITPRYRWNANTGEAAVTVQVGDRFMIRTPVAPYGCTQDYYISSLPGPDIVRADRFRELTRSVFSEFGKTPDIGPLVAEKPGHTTLELKQRRDCSPISYRVKISLDVLKSQ